MTFKKGKSGNPNGRPSGVTNKRTQLFKLLEPHAEELIAKAVELACGGDVHALRLCLERLIPKAQYEISPLDIDASKTNEIEYLAIIGKELIIAVSNGTITSKEAQTVSTLLEKQRKLIEHGVMKRQLEEIKEAIQDKI